MRDRQSDINRRFLATHERGCSSSLDRIFTPPQIQNHRKRQLLMEAPTSFFPNIQSDGHGDLDQLTIQRLEYRQGAASELRGRLHQRLLKTPTEPVHGMKGVQEFTKIMRLRRDSLNVLSKRGLPAFGLKLARGYLDTHSMGQRCHWCSNHHCLVL